MTDTQLGHMRFVAGTILCPRMERRYNLGDDHRYGQEFVCPGCGVRIPATAYYKRKQAAKT